MASSQGSHGSLEIGDRRESPQDQFATLKEENTAQASKRPLCKMQKQVLRRITIGAAIVLSAANPSFATKLTLPGQGMSLTVQSEDGSYEILGENLDQALIHARIAAEIDHKWVRPGDYPEHKMSQSAFKDALGGGARPLLHHTNV
jgi:hypothetical protein